MYIKYFQGRGPPYAGSRIHVVRGPDFIHLWFKKTWNSMHSTWKKIFQNYTIQNGILSRCKCKYLLNRLLGTANFKQKIHGTPPHDYKGTIIKCHSLHCNCISI